MAVRVEMVSSVELDNGKQPEELLKDVDCILIPSGFGDCGIIGKIKAIQYARERGSLFRNLLRDAVSGCRICPECSGA